MHNFCDALGIRRKISLGAAGLAALTLPVALGLIDATPTWSQSQAQAAATPTPIPTSPPVYEYEVASIKRDKSPGFSFPGAGLSSDEFKVTNVPLEILMIGAFGLMPNQIVGMPDWLLSEKYDVDAKMDPTVADALKKLSQDDRKSAQQHMLQALLADRCKLVFHRETREGATYTLVVAKNGPKFHESKPGETIAGGMKVPDGHGGTITVRVKGAAMSFSDAPITVLVPMLTAQLGHVVVDKTGLTGKYDFTWQFIPPDASQLRPPDMSQAPGASQSPATAAPPRPMAPFGAMDPSAVSAAVQDQLGLKLESAKGPVEIVVIDHIERPSED